MTLNYYMLSFLEKIRGTNILNSYYHLLETQNYTRQEIEMYQLSKLIKLLDHCRQNVPFYKKFFKENGVQISDFKTLKDISILPVMEKASVREMYYNKQLISTNSNIYKPIINQTGGSTGIPLKLLVGKQARNISGGAVLRYYNWMGKNLFNDKLAVLWGDMRVKSITERLSDDLKCFFTKRKYFSCFSMDEKILAQHYEAVLKFNPPFLRGYAFAVYLFAQFQQEVIKQKKLNLKGISITTEKITSSQRKFIEDEFECPVFDQYGGGETSMIAGECTAHNGMHITEEHVIVETNENDEFIVTDLDNYAMPFIRYRNCDLGKLIDEPCKCGMVHKRIINLIGRIDDTINTQNGKVINTGFFCTVFEYMTTVKAFQVNYYGMDKMEIDLVKHNSFGPKDVEYIKSKIEIAFGVEQSFNLNTVNSIRQNPNGKTKCVNVHKN